MPGGPIDAVSEAGGKAAISRIWTATPRAAQEKFHRVRGIVLRYKNPGLPDGLRNER